SLYSFRKGSYSYFCLHSRNKNGIEKTYLKNENLIKKYVNIEYNRKLLVVLKEITKVVEHAYKKACRITGNKSIRENTSPLKTKYLNPVYSIFRTTDYWKQTNARKVDTRKHPFLTAKGDYVRSKSEMIIANTLFYLGIPYVYEPIITLEGIRIIPDFEILNCMTGETIILEHFGMMDNPEYAAKAIAKINAYYKAGFSEMYNLILTYETRENPLTPEIVRKKILSFMNTVTVRAEGVKN
ncbi:MAG: hypothetical protein K5634_00910, partial [Sphaerochaetaceae bacterium]|nr:hypothetical protein [Sphaerochaetaceae bacterium]